MKEERDQEVPIFDYMYREVSAVSGQGSSEAFTAFFEMLHTFETVKKIRIRVSDGRRGRARMGLMGRTCAKRDSRS